MKTITTNLVGKILSVATMGVIISGCGGGGSNSTFPSGVNINSSNIIAYIASTYDNTPFNPPINIQGVIDMGTTPKGLLVKVPYKVTGSNPVTIPAYSKNFTLASSSTQDNESGIVATFSWDEQANLVGSGFFNAYITIDDSAGDNNNVFKAKKLDVDNVSGIVAATFDYPKDNMGNKGTLALKIVPVIPDRMFQKADNNGDKTTHNFLYVPVTNPVTGKTWLNNNLGADYANIHNPNFNLTQQAKTSGDYHAYGSLFQWGRKADGHELIHWTDTSTGTSVYAKTSTNADNPTHPLFITEPNNPYDWRVHNNNTLWTSEASVNNVCPKGYRLPLNPNETNDSENEFYQEVKTWSSQDKTGALSSVLALPASGFRSGNTGTLSNGGYSGTYWSGSTFATTSSNLSFWTSINTLGGSRKSDGYSVRCIKN